MANLVQTIKFKIFLAFGMCVILMAAIGLFAAYGLSKLNANVADGYSGNTIRMLIYRKFVRPRLTYAFC